MDKDAKLHENASTQIDVPTNVAAKILELSKGLIPDDALSGDGRVEHLHLTLKYGVKPDAELLRQALVGQQPFTVTLGKVMVFEPSETTESPVVVEARAAELGPLHESVGEKMGTFRDTFPYNPHVTVAYVRPDAAEQFAGSDAFAGITFRASAVTLSKQDDDNQVKLPLGKTAASPGVAPEIPQRPEVKRDEPAVEPQPEPGQKKPAPKKQPKKKMTPQDADKLVGDAARRTRKKQRPMRPTETPQFKAWFSGSKIVGADRKPLMLFHGTTHEITEFDPARASAEAWYGPGLYFTDSKIDVAANYATDKGPDITRNIENRADSIMDDLREEYEEANEHSLDYNSEDYKELWAKAYDTVKGEFAGPNLGVTMPVYVNMKNPVYVLKKGGTEFNIDFDEETGEESGSGLALYNALNLAGGNFGGDTGKIWERITENGTEFSAWDFEDAVRASDDIQDDEGRMVPGNLIAQIYQKMNFDGIVQDAWNTFGGGAYKKDYGDDSGIGMKMDKGARHYILWDPSKVKSAIGNVGTFSPKSPSIVASASPALRRWFGASKVVDDSFEPRVVFHGSKSPWVTSFDMGMEGTGVHGSMKWGAIWFTSSAENAEEFADTPEEKTEASIDEVTVYGNDPYYAAVFDINGESLFEVGPHPTEEEAQRDGATQATEYNKHLGENTNVQGYYLKIVRPYVTDQVPREKEFEAARAGKHDGIIAKDVIDGYTRSDVFVVFSPAQVKSTRSVKFDPASAHLTAAGGKFPSFAQYIKKNGGVIKLLESMGDAWNHYVETAGMAVDGFDELPPAEQEKAAEQYAYEDLANQYGDRVHFFRGVMYPTAIYRKVKLKSREELNTGKVGVFWSWSESKAEAHWSTGGGNTVTLRAELDSPNQVDWDDTMFVNLDPSTGENEDECRLKEGAKLRLTGVNWGDEQQLSGQWGQPPQATVTAAVEPEAKERLDTLGQDVVEERTIGDYDLFVTYDRNFGVYQIGMQRVGMDASDIGQQAERQRQDRGRGDRRELVATVQGWVDKYHLLIIGSMNPAKTEKYVRLLRMLGFKPIQKELMGIPFAMLTDGTVKLGSIKIAGRKDAVTSLVMRADAEGFPEVRVRWEGLRWRQVLKAVKAIAGEVAGHRVPWDDIQIFNSPWKSLDEQEAGWHSSKSSGQVMFDVLKNGSWVSVGASYRPEAEALGATEHPWDGNAAYEQHALNMFAAKQVGKDIGGQPEWVLGRVAAWEKVATEMVLPAGTALYRGVGEEKVEPASVAADGCLWTTQSPTMARTYIPASGLTLYTSLRALVSPPDDRSGTGDVQKQLGYEFTDVDYKGQIRAQSFRYPAVRERLVSGTPVPERPADTKDKAAMNAYYEAWDRRNAEADTKFAEWVKARLKEYGYEPEKRGGEESYKLYVTLKNGKEELLQNEYQQGTLLTFETLEPLRIFDMTEGGRREGDLMDPQYREYSKFEQLAKAGYDGVRIADFAQSEDQGNVGHDAIGLFQRALPKIREARREAAAHPKDLWAEAKKYGSHKTPPLSDTRYENPERGMETNAYADIPERVKGIYETPSLEELAPQMFKRSSHFQFPSFADYLKAHPETLENPGDEEEYAHKEINYDDTVAGLDFDFPLIVYRSVELPEGTPPNFEETGVFWSSNADSAQAYFGSTSIWSPKTTEPKAETHEVMIAAQVLKPEDVEWYQTLVANVLNPEENEVTVVKGSQLRLVAVDGKKVKRRMITAAFSEQQNQVQHTDHKAIGMSKTLKGDPFAEEYALLHGGAQPSLGPPASDAPPKGIAPHAEGEEDLAVMQGQAMKQGASPFVFGDPSERDKTYTTDKGETFERLPGEQGDETPPNKLFEKQYGKPFDTRKLPESPKRPVTETPEFRAWFGDSKAVNAKGEPQMVFHSTRAKVDFEEFKTSPVKEEGGWAAKSKPGDPFDAIGAWFAADKKLLNEVFEFYRMRRRGPPRTVPVYLSIKTPLVVEHRTDLEGRMHELIQKYLPKVWAKWHRMWNEQGMKSPSRLAKAKAARKACEMAGYDGVKIVNDYHGEAWVAFYPNQIKSAIGNTGKFDPSSPSITASETALFARVAGDVPRPVLDAAQRMLDDLHGNTRLCGDSGVVDGWWVETHTLGCRDAADEPEESWQESHDRILDEYENDGISHVIMDDSGIFATMTPQRGIEKNAAKHGKFTGEVWAKELAPPPVIFQIEVPKESRDHFSQESVKGMLEFWAFKDRPRCFVNERIVFTFDGRPFAEARVLRIEEPGNSACAQTKKYRDYYKVLWSPNTVVKYQ
jgi:2'-5' RNA ligase